MPPRNWSRPHLVGSLNQPGVVRHRPEFDQSAAETCFVFASGDQTEPESEGRSRIGALIASERLHTFVRCSLSRLGDSPPPSFYTLARQALDRLAKFYDLMQTRAAAKQTPPVPQMDTQCARSARRSLGCQHLMLVGREGGGA